jgi:hypothetical protein
MVPMQLFSLPRTVILLGNLILRSFVFSLPGIQCVTLVSALGQAA